MSTSLLTAKELFKENFIGPHEINSVADQMGLSKISEEVELPFDEERLKQLALNYILIFGVSTTKDGESLTLNWLRSFFGVDPETKEPCFYNQDWYLNEDFSSKDTLENKWYLIKKEVEEETRGKDPEDITTGNNQVFPKAILTAFTFFAYFFINNKKLWENDFIWCSDKDHNGDIIYTGRYTDPTGVNKNGFNIHRHLSIRPSYGLAPQVV